MAGLCEQILALGEKLEISELEAVVEKETAETIQGLINKKLTHPDIERFLKYVFGALTYSGPCQSKRIKLIERSLDELQTRDLSCTTIRTVMAVLNCQMRKLGPSHLVRLMQWCLDSRQKDNAVTEILWQELLPNLLNLAENFKKVEYCGKEMAGADFKKEVIDMLCMQSWDSNMVTPMAAMFVKVELTPQEQSKILYKLLQGMKTLEPASLPPLVNQLLVLTRKQNGLQVILDLREYFSEHLYDKICLSYVPVNSEESITRGDNPAFSRPEVSRAESTVLFYIKQSAGMGYASVREFLRSIKSATTAPELCLNPFFFTTLFSVASVEAYEREVYYMICRLMIRELAEINMKQKSFWLQEVVPTHTDMDNLFHQLLSCCGKEREMVRVGIVNLALALLKLGTHRAGAPETWKWGVLILVRVVRKYYDVIRTVALKLSHRIIIMKDIEPYTDALLKMCVTAPLKMGECQPIFIDLVENAMNLRASRVEQVFASLMPLIKNFSMIRERTLLILRKSTFACKLEFRLMAVRTYLRILKVFDNESCGYSDCSQSSTVSSVSSNPITQVRIEHSEPEPDVASLGAEIMKVLQRCLIQQLDVRSTLYSGLYPAVFRNEILYSIALDFLVPHVYKYYEKDELTLPPLNFTKAFGEDCSKGPEEPLGQLIFLIQKLVTNEKRFFEASTLKSYITLQKMLDSLVDRMIKCSPSTFDMTEDVNFTDQSPEGKVLYETYLQVLQVYEALMAYTVMMWYLDHEDKHQTIIMLFRNYSKFLELGKSGSKTPKNKKSKTPKGSENKKGAAKVKAILKNPPTVLDLDAAICFLKLLFSDSLSWAAADETRGLRSRREFCRYILQITLQLLQRHFRRKPSELDLERSLGPRCKAVIRVLYERFLKDNGENRGADNQIVTLALECFNELLHIIERHCSGVFTSWLSEVVAPDAATLEDMLQIAIPNVIKCLELSLDSGEQSENDPAAKKIPHLLASILAHLCLKSPRQCPVTTQIFAWIKKFIMERKLFSGPLVREIVSLLFKMQIRHKTDGAIFDKVALQLLHLVGPIDTEKDKSQPVHQYNMLSDLTQVIWMQQLYLTLKEMLDDIDWVINRLRGELAARQYPGVESKEQREENLAKQEREVCTHISHCVKVTTILTRGAFPEGPMVDCVLKLLFHLYSSLSNLAKYFTTRSTKTNLAYQAARFPNVIQLAAHDLAGEVQWFVLHAIAPDDPDEVDKKKYNKKQAVRRALKDIKLVPRVVYAVELFDKYLLHLSKKCKVDLTRRVKMLSGRDFRINLTKVKESLERQRKEKANESTKDDEDDDDDDGGEDGEGAKSQEEEGNVGPSAKRMKKQ